MGSSQSTELFDSLQYWNTLEYLRILCNARILSGTNWYIAIKCNRTVHFGNLGGACFDKTRLLCAMMVFISFILYLICLSKCFREDQTFVRHDGCPKLLCAAMMDVQKSYLGDGSDPIKQRRENAKRKSKKKHNQTSKHCNNCIILLNGRYF